MGQPWFGGKTICIVKWIKKSSIQLSQINQENSISGKQFHFEVDTKDELFN